MWDFGEPLTDVSKFGQAAIEADGCMLAAGAGEQNSGHLCRTLLRPVEIRMEKLRLKLDATPGGHRAAIVRLRREIRNLTIAALFMSPSFPQCRK
jgi:hypothetical protein